MAEEDEVQLQEAAEVKTLRRPPTAAEEAEERGSGRRRPTAAEEEVQLLPMASPGGASPSSAKLAAPQLPEAAPREIEEEEQQ